MAANVDQGGVRVLTAWEQTQAWKAARRAMREQFESDAQATRAAFDTAQINRIDLTFDIVIQSAIDRVNAETPIKVAQAARLAPSPQVSSNKELPTTIYAGGTTIDLDSDTITLDDGTVIDLHTGVKTDVTV